MWRPAPSVCKWNKIISFVLSVKLWVKIHFLQDPLKAHIFYQTRFLYGLPKNPEINICWQLMIIIFLFKTFFSLVNNKVFFVIHPLKKSFGILLLLFFFLAEHER